MNHYHKVAGGDKPARVVMWKDKDGYYAAVFQGLYWVWTNTSRDKRKLRRKLRRSDWIH